MLLNQLSVALQNNLERSEATSLAKRAMIQSAKGRVRATSRRDGHQCPLAGRGLVGHLSDGFGVPLIGLAFL